MLTKLLKLALAVTLLSSALTANAAPTYTFSILESLGGASREGEANSINNSGQIVGKSKDTTGAYQATLWSSLSPSAPTLLQSPVTNTYALSINNSGKIVGSDFNPVGVSRSFLWDSTSPNSPTELIAIGGVGKESKAVGINNSGQIVGGSGMANTHYNGTLWSPTSPSTYSPTELVALGGTAKQSEPWAINDRGLVTGWSQNDQGLRKAAAWYISSPNSPILLESLGGTGRAGDVYAINDSGMIVGVSADASNVEKATLWNITSPNSPILLESLGGTAKDAIAFGINSSGVIVGLSKNASSVGKATLWDGANVIDLNDYLDQASKNAGWVLDFAGDINDSGSIVGLASNNLLGLTSQAFLLQSVAAVPEADTSAMLLMGAGVMGFIARRRKQVAA
jgi:probable HAF family extracellular repeat protein